MTTRRQKRLKERQFGEHAEGIRARRCCVCGSSPPSHAHHVRTRGAGGTSADLVPLCWTCHEAVHRMGAASFDAANNTNLRAIADSLAEGVAP